MDGLVVLLFVLIVLVGLVLGALVSKLISYLIHKNTTSLPLDSSIEDTDHLEKRATGLIVLATQEQDDIRRKKLRDEAYKSLKKWDRRKNGS